MEYFLIFIAIIEIYYWFWYVPKAWKNGSNKELEDIKNYIKKMEEIHDDRGNHVL